MSVGMFVGVSVVFVVMSIGLCVGNDGDGDVGSRVGVVTGRLEGANVGTETTGDRDGAGVGCSSIFLDFFILFGVGVAVGERLFDIALIFRCSPRNWRRSRVVAAVAAGGVIA